MPKKPFKNQPIKEAFSQALKEKEEERIRYYKEIVKQYLNKLETLQKDHRELVKKIQVIKRDLKDLSQGRLDRIEERQKLDPEAKNTSILIVDGIDTNATVTVPWKMPYECSWTYNATTLPSNEMKSITDEITLTGSFCQNNTSGAYQLDSGVIKHL